VIDYRWIAESVTMASTTLTRDLIAAVDHACNVPGNLTPTQVDRLSKLQSALEDTLR
jgi:hypothetical protein